MVTSSKKGDESLHNCIIVKEQSKTQVNYTNDMTQIL